MRNEVGKQVMDGAPVSGVQDEKPAPRLQNTAEGAGCRERLRSSIWKLLEGVLGHASGVNLHYRVRTTG